MMRHVFAVILLMGVWRCALGADVASADFPPRKTPAGFSAPLPEGNYNVTIAFGDDAAESDTTVKAETRRLMIENVHARPGESITRTFTVNIRTPKIGAGGEVHLTSREKGVPHGVPHWDEKLSLEFLGAHPAIRSVRISPAPDAITVYLAGDSTVTDQVKEPWAGWGQMLPRFFNSGVAIANHAESGRSLKSFKDDRRLEKILSQIKPGDYLFIQFGHNDQKEKGEGVGPFTSYKQSLRDYIAAARAHGATPVLITPMYRRRFNAEGKLENSLGDYPEAVRQTAKEENAPLIDLHAMSKALFEALGPEGSKRAFVHYPAGAFPGQDQPLKDDTHFGAYGAYELAKCIARGIRDAKLPLAGQLATGFPPLDPAHPDSPESLILPSSPTTQP